MARSSIIGALRVDLAMDSANFEAGAAKARQTSGALKSELGGLSSAFAPLAAGAALGAGALAAFSAGMRNAAATAQFADDLVAMADRIGVSAEALQALRHAAEVNDIPMAELDDGLKALNGTLGALQSRIGDGKIRKAFEALGIPQSTIANLQDASDLLPILADRISQVGTHAERVQIARKLGIESLLPLLMQGSKGIAELVEQARSLNLVMDEGVARRMADLNEEMRVADQRSAAASHRLSAEFVPVLVAIKEAAADAASALAGMLSWANRAATVDGKIQQALERGQKARGRADTIRNGSPLEAMMAGNIPGLAMLRSGWRARFAAEQEAAAAEQDRVVERLALEQEAKARDAAAKAAASAGGAALGRSGGGTGKPKTKWDWSKLNDFIPAEIDKDTIADLTKVEPKDLSRLTADLREASGNGLLNGMADALQKSRDQVRESYRWAISGAFEAFAYGGGKGLMHYLADQFRYRLMDNLAQRLASVFEQATFSTGTGGKQGLFATALNFGRSVMGFANGGSFTVGGSGGTDSQLVQFKASPNERVTVTTPGQGGGLMGLVVQVDKSDLFDVHVRAAAAPLVAQGSAAGAQAGAAMAEQRIVRRSKQTLGGFR